MENIKELFIDIIRIDKNKKILTLTSKDFIYSEDVSDKNTEEVAKEIQERIIKIKDMDIERKNIILEQNYNVYVCEDGEGMGLIDALASIGVIVNHVKSGNINHKLPKSNNLIEANKIINTRTYEKLKENSESEDNESDVKPLERIIYEKNFRLQNNSDSTGYILAQYNSLKNMIVNAIHFKKHILLDGNLIRSMGKSQILADLSAAYQLPILIFLSAKAKEIKSKNSNSKPIGIAQWKQHPLTDEKIILVDDIPRAELSKLINEGYIVIGFVI